MISSNTFDDSNFEDAGKRRKGRKKNFLNICYQLSFVVCNLKNLIKSVLLGTFLKSF